ncbi:MAG: GNAT family N-acetyltransferase [Acidobacteriota bacterium]
MTEFKVYDESDLDAVVRMWKEVGWIERDEQRNEVAHFLAAGVGEVARIDGEAECLVHRSPGSVHYASPLGEGVDLKLSAITAVTTSPIARRRGFASRLTARALAAAAEEGFAVAALGMFEQGFYDRLGFGTSGYEHLFRFDPAQLRVEHIPFRAPERLSPQQAEDIHGALQGRMRHHGAIRIDSSEFVKGEFTFHERFYGLGYRDEEGALTHCLVGSMKDEYGPWNIFLIAYRTTEQLLELFRLLYELSDQFRAVRLYQPAHVQLQALLGEPFRERQRSAGSPMASEHEAHAWMQLRILDVEACVAACRFAGEPLSFNLDLTDPAADKVSDDLSWKGAGGCYTVSLGPTSSASRGSTEGLPVLVADVGSFTRLWFGVGRPSTLAVTDSLQAAPELLSALERVIALPQPVAGMEF